MRQNRLQMAPDSVLIVLCLIAVYGVLFVESSAPQRSPLSETPALMNYPQGLQQLLTCEGETMNINCTMAATIKLHGAKFGREQNLNVCGHHNVECSSTKAFSHVDERCNYKTNCSIFVHPSTLGDSQCGKGIKAYLHVTYSCISLHPPQTTPKSTLVPSVDSETISTAKVDQTCGPYVGSIMCRKCLRRNITWPETDAGQWATAPCPNNKNRLEARLECGLNPVEWKGHPDLSKCVSSKVESIQSELKATKHVDLMTLGRIAVDLTTISHEEENLAGGDLVGITQAMHKVVEHLDVSARNKTISGDAEKFIQQVSSAVLDVTNTVLDDRRTTSWNDIPQMMWGSVATQLMTTVETSAFQIASAMTLPQKVTNVANNLVLEVSVIKADADVLMEDAVFPSADALKGSLWEKTTNCLRLPVESLRSLAENGLAKVVFTSYSNLENLLLPNATPTGDGQRRFRSFCSDLTENSDCDAIINTKIISATINSRKLSGSEMPLPKPVVFTLQHRIIENVSAPVCAYWKVNEDGDGGEWMTDGCESESNLTHTTCSCNHLTSFAVIMSPTSPNMSAADALALDVLTYIGCSISIICLFLSFLTFSCFRSLQCDRNTIHKNLVLCLFVTNMIFLIGINLYDFPILCSVIAGFLHYFFLTSFAWMCIEGVQLYYMLIKVFEADKSHVLWFYLSAYGIPAIIVAISAAVYHEGYGTEQYCWLTTDQGFVWSFLAPALAIIVTNSVMLGIALRAMYRHSLSAATWRMKEKTTVQQIRSWVKGSLVLVVLLGLTWTFGLLFVSEATIAFAYIFTILNSIQGLFIFIFHCLLNDKVQAEYKRCVRNATCLPERFRIWYGGARASYTTNQNKSSSSSSTGGKYFTRLLTGRQRQGSNSTSISRLTSSQKRLSFLKQEEEKAVPANVVSDSGIEDPSSYQEGVQIHLGESEFNTVGNSSVLEGSVADTDYADRLTKRQSSREQNSQNARSPPVMGITSEEPRNDSRQRHSRKNRNHSSLSDPGFSDQHEHEIQSPHPCTVIVNSPDPVSVPSQRVPGTKRKSSKKAHQDLGSAEVFTLEKVPKHAESHHEAAEDSTNAKHGIKTDDEITRRRSKTPASSSVRISGKTTGV